MSKSEFRTYNLSEWAIRYYNDHELMRNKPARLATAVAFDLLIGKERLRLENYICLTDGKTPCYSVGHKQAFNLPPVFLLDPQAAFQHIEEYSIQEASQEHPHPILREASPIILQALKSHYEEDVLSLFEKFSNMTSSELRAIPEQLNVFTKDEIDSVHRDLEGRKELCEKFLDEVRNQDVRSLRK